MPWIIRAGGRSPWYEFHEKHLPNHSFPAWTKAYLAWAKDRDAKGEIRGESNYIEELYGIDPVRLTERLPRKFYWKKRGKLKDCASFKAFLVVSGRVRDLIEELDPGINDYYPIEMENSSTGEIWPEPFWLVHVRNVVDGIDDERSNSAKQAFRADAIADVHLWRDPRPMYRDDLFGSDRFVEELERRGIEGIGAYPYCPAV